MPFKTVGIIGVGLMGGSLARALRVRFPSIRLVGFARKASSYRKLKKLKIVDVVSRDIARVVQLSDLVVLAAPVSVIEGHIRKIAPFLKRGAVVIDLGSTKTAIHTTARRSIGRYAHFVGCHPLCGLEVTGPRHADRNLYKGALCIITSKGKAAAMVSNMWRALGAKTFFMTPVAHDKVLAYVSHLPHVISFALTHYVPKKCFRFASGSFRDLTRVSRSSPDLWAQIFCVNRKNVSRVIRQYIRELEAFNALIRKNDRKKIVRLIAAVNVKQKTLQ